MAENPTQQQLATRAKVERQWLSLLESGSQTNPTLGKVMRTLAALNLELQVVEKAPIDGPDLASLIRGPQ